MAGIETGVPVEALRLQGDPIGRDIDTQISEMLGKMSTSEVEEYRDGLLSGAANNPDIKQAVERQLAFYDKQESIRSDIKPLIDFLAASSAESRDNLKLETVNALLRLAGKTEVSEAEMDTAINELNSEDIIGAIESSLVSSAQLPADSEDQRDQRSLSTIQSQVRDFVHGQTAPGHSFATEVSNAVTWLRRKDR